LRIRLLCVGRMKHGPERNLVNDYLARARKTGKQLGYRAVEEIEIPTSSIREEGERLLARHPGGPLVRLDETGQPWPSETLSRRLARWRDAGEDSVSFVIGGPDGTSQAVAERAVATLGFGAQTWPHMLVRVMLAEQVYRALSIEAGSPYHRQ
jgi:23S rRNA (pseudouridine1915-N3)-methyltransferase